jgi:cation:H+ antiporter
VILSIVLMSVGLALLVGGAEALVRGASALARRMGVSPIVVGLTVVAFGTSTPELAVNVSAAIDGNTGISFGNVVGSNIANVALILAVAALVRPLDVGPTIINREIPMLLLGTAAALAMAMDRSLDGAAANRFGRVDGIVLVLLFGVFLYYTILTALRQRAGDQYVAELREEVAARPPQRLWVSLLLTALGLAGVIVGGRWTVDNAVLLARQAGMPEELIGLTFIAVGTGLPELVTSVIAAWRGHSDLAVGNVVGSNIYNLLFVLGATAIVRPVEVPSLGRADLLVMGAVTAALLPLSLYRHRRLGRPGGLLLLAAYVGYVAWRASAAAAAPAA